MQSGTRPEEIEEQSARLAGAQEEIAYLQEVHGRLDVTAPLAGVITTPRLVERIGQYLREGDLICCVEEPVGMEVEIALAEQEVARIREGQKVRLKARSAPFETFQTQVARIAPAADVGEAASFAGDVQSSASRNVTIYCRLDNGSAVLKPGMTGYARVYTGPRPIGAVLLHRLMRFIRTEFWW